MRMNLFVAGVLALGFSSFSLAAEPVYFPGENASAYWKMHGQIRECLFRAGEGKSFQIPDFKALGAEGAEVNAYVGTDLDGEQISEPLLSWVVRRAVPRKARSVKQEIVRRLIEAGASPDLTLMRFKDDKRTAGSASLVTAANVIDESIDFEGLSKLLAKSKLSVTDILKSMFRFDTWTYTESQLKFIEHLIEKGANPHVVSADSSLVAGTTLFQFVTKRTPYIQANGYHREGKPASSLSIDIETIGGDFSAGYTVTCELAQWKRIEAAFKKAKKR